MDLFDGEFAGCVLWEQQDTPNAPKLIDPRQIVGSTSLHEVKIVAKKSDAKGEHILVWKNFDTGAKPVWILMKNLDKHKSQLIDPPEGTEDHLPAVGQLGPNNELIPPEGKDSIPNVDPDEFYIPHFHHMVTKAKELGVVPQNTFSKAIAAGEPIPKEMPPSAGGVENLPKDPEKAPEPPPAENPADPEPEPEKSKEAPANAAPEPEKTPEPEKEPEKEPEPEKAKEPEHAAGPPVEPVQTLNFAEFGKAMTNHDFETMSNNAGKFDQGQLAMLKGVANGKSSGAAAFSSSVLQHHFETLAKNAKTPEEGKAAQNEADTYALLSNMHHEELNKKVFTTENPVPPPPPDPPPANAEDQDLVFEVNMKPPKDYKPPSLSHMGIFKSDSNLLDHEFIHPASGEVFQVLGLTKHDHIVDSKTGQVIKVTFKGDGEGGHDMEVVPGPHKIMPVGKEVVQPPFNAPLGTPAVALPAQKAPPPEAKPKKKPKKPSKAETTPSSIKEGDMPPSMPVAPELVVKPSTQAAAEKVKPLEGVPSQEEFKYFGSAAHLGGFGGGDKNYYVDAQGNKWLHKTAFAAMNGQAKPYAAVAAQCWSAIAKHIKPDTYIPCGVVTLKDDKGKSAFGSVQRMIDLDPDKPCLEEKTSSGGHGKIMHPKTLSAQDHKDIMQECVLDWLMSQHDSHGGNFVRRADGRLTAIDKDQSFRFFGEDRKTLDDPTYHPNSTPTYYNHMWKAAMAGEIELEPLVDAMKETLEKVEKLNTADYVKTLKPYVESLHPNQHPEQMALLNKIRRRKIDMRKDLERLVTSVYRGKHNKPAGSFTFDHGWDDGSGVKPKKKKEGPKVVTTKHTFNLTDSTGSGVTKSGTGWQVKVPGHSEISIKPYHDPANPGTPDPSKVTLKVHAQGANPAAKLQNFANDLGIKLHKNPAGETSFITGSSYVMAFATKSDIENAHIETSETVHPEPEADDHGSAAIKNGSSQPRYFPDDFAHAPHKPNSHELKHVASTHLGFAGKRFSADGPMVEGSAHRARRFVTQSGETYHHVQFKLRAPVWKALKGGDSVTYGFPVATYDRENDVFREAGVQVAHTKMKRWKVGNSEVYLGTDETGSSGHFSHLGSVHMKIRPKPGQSHDEAVAELLDAMKPGLSKELLRNPTPEEEELHKLSRMLWAVSPQEADALKEEHRTIPELKKRLAKHEDRLKNIENKEVFHGFSGHVEKGRWRKLAGGKLQFGFHGVGTEHAIPSILLNGLAGANTRLSAGNFGITNMGPEAGASLEKDIVSGSADGVLLRPVTESGKGRSFSDHYADGIAQLIIHPEEFDRLDTYQHQSDCYGVSRPDHAYGSAWKTRGSLEQQMADQQSSYKTGAETSFRGGILPHRILRVTTADEGTRKSLIKKCKAMGVHEHNGVPIEDFIVVETNLGKAHEKYVKPVIEGAYHD